MGATASPSLGPAPPVAAPGLCSKCAQGRHFLCSGQLTVLAASPGVGTMRTCGCACRRARRLRGEPRGVRGALVRMWARASAMNRENVLRLIEPQEQGTLLDLGCHDGAWTLRVAERMRARKVLGVEFSPSACERARALGVDARVGDLNQPFPLADESVDVVHSNQVIEHLYDVDGFLAETRRVLRPGGYAVISTENLASWTNVWPLFLGWQPFSLTNVSRAKAGIGNPLALHGGDHTREGSWGHVRVFSLRGLRDIVQAHGLAVEKVAGAGYYPLPAVVGRVHPTHAHFITVKARKPPAAPEQNAY